MPVILFWPQYIFRFWCFQHGAAVFLYHPCAPAKEINAFKRIAKHCLHRRIITPYKELPPDSVGLNWHSKNFPEISSAIMSDVISSNMLD